VTFPSRCENCTFVSSVNTMLGQMRWAGHVACVGNVYKILVGIPEGKRRLGRCKHRWKIILEWNLGNWNGKFWTGFIWLRTGTSGGML
jgi:hypothetical protein